MSQNPSQDELSAALKSLDELVEEAVQTYELDKEKTNVTDELYNSLKIITKYLGFSISIEPKSVGMTEDAKVTLLPTLDLLIVKPNGKSEQKRLDQLSLDEASNILRTIIPTLIKLAREDRIVKNQKVTFVREATKRLKRLPGSNVEDMIITDSSYETGGV